MSNNNLQGNLVDKFVVARIQSEEEQIQKMENGTNDSTGLNSKQR